ncbi:hypothetical protein [Prochlorococcus marinus]|uniref:hypothetical protein n=1 Tax=Prochlorococcus marinus TaxID=1219 RepID=UPI00094DDB31|nr:hypothetical protein [Prochlorococcus marinus]
MYYDRDLLACVPCNDIIRIGRNKDGGYLIPSRIIFNSKSLISGGICTDWSFETQFINYGKIREFFFVDKDTSLRSLFLNSFRVFKRNLPIKIKIKQFFYCIYNSPRIFFFRRKYGSRFIDAYITSSKEELSYHKSMTTIPSLISKLSFKNELSSIFIKLDIEGSEWKVIDDIISLCPLISGLAIEVHDLDINGKKLDYFISELDERGIKLVHVHPNNAVGLCKGSNLPRLLELSFINSNLLTKEELNLKKNEPFKYNYKYDRPCDPKVPELF